MKKFALVFLALAVAGNYSVAAGAATGTTGEDNNLVVNLSAVVSRHCNLDFDSGSGSAQIVTEDRSAAVDKIFLSDIASALPEQELISPMTVYETCNEGFQLSFSSANGGLALGNDPAKRNVDYIIHYQGVDMSAEMAQSASSLSAPFVVKRDLSKYQALAGNANSSWQHSPASLKFGVVPQKGLPTGQYQDSIQISMSTQQ
jgi:hypothetical protein